MVISGFGTNVFCSAALLQKNYLKSYKKFIWKQASLAAYEATSPMANGETNSAANAATNLATDPPTHPTDSAATNPAANAAIASHC